MRTLPPEIAPPYVFVRAGLFSVEYVWADFWGRGLDAWAPIPQSATPLVSGFIAGAIFRSTAGVRAAAITGTIVMGVAGAWQIVKRNL